MKDAKLEVPFAMLFAQKLSALPLTGNAAGDCLYACHCCRKTMKVHAQARDDGAFRDFAGRKVRRAGRS